MAGTLQVSADSWNDGEPIPAKFAFCAPAPESHVTMSTNISPALNWAGAPDGTRSFAILCIDVDVPSAPDDVNQEDREVPVDLPRIDFFHWVLVDIAGDATGIAEGADSDSITAGGKALGQTSVGVRGLNNFTDWFAGDADMGGDYGGYDGPCPPWNDSIIHHYHFHIYALDIKTLGLDGQFGGPEAQAAMKGHVLAEGSMCGTYNQNPRLGT